MMKPHKRRSLIDFSDFKADDLFGTKEKFRGSGANHSKADILDEELRKCYHQEALTLNAVIENMTRLYMTRFQELEKQLKTTNLEVEQAERQQWEAQRTQSELLLHNRELIRKVQQLRQTLERQQERKHRNQTHPEITHWKLVDQRMRHHM